jgi:hypothetical protein
MRKVETSGGVTNLKLKGLIDIMPLSPGGHGCCEKWLDTKPIRLSLLISVRGPATSGVFLLKARWQ